MRSTPASTHAQRREEIDQQEQYREPVHRGIIMLSEDMVGKLLECGEFCLRNGLFTDAITAFRLANAKEKLILCGEICYMNALYVDAIAAFRAANATDRLVACGERFMETSRYGHAVKAFAAAAGVQATQDRRPCDLASCAIT